MIREELAEVSRVLFHFFNLHDTKYEEMGSTKDSGVHHYVVSEHDLDKCCGSIIVLVPEFDIFLCFIYIFNDVLQQKKKVPN